MKPEKRMSVDELRQRRQEQNLKLMGRLREDTHAEALLEACREDAERHRMSKPRFLGLADLYSESMSPRFAVEQGSAALNCILARVQFCAV